MLSDVESLVTGMNNNETIHVAPSGDLTISLFGSADSLNKRRKLGNRTHDVSSNDVQNTFIVSSAVMRLASPVWQIMLDPQGHFMESFSNGEVHFAEDNAAALLLILRIAHLQFREIPQSLDLPEMVSLAVVCDKYDTAGLVRPWVKQWEESLREHFDLLNDPDCEEYIFFAWTFGDISTYEKIAERLIFDSTSDNEGQLFADGNLLGKNLPPGAVGESCLGGTLNARSMHGANTDRIKDCILEARKKTVTQLLGACSKLVEKYESDHILCQAITHFGPSLPLETKRQCDTLVYGCLIKGLKKLGLWPGPIFPSDVHRSITKLMLDLRSMTCFMLGGETSHANCVFTAKLVKQIRNIELTVSSGIDDPLRKHMEEQAKK